MTRKGKKFEWTEDEIGFLKKNYGDLSLDDIGFALGISHSTVRLKAIEIGLENRNARRVCEWTEERVGYLKDHYDTDTLWDISQHVGFSVPTVKKKADELGLRRPDTYRPSDFNRRYVKDYKNVV